MFWKKNKKRYFLISYTANLPEGYAHGHMTFAYEGSFPPQSCIKAEVIEGSSMTNVVIMNVFEFKNQQDFESFKGK